jgi:hypothetical protein
MRIARTIASKTAVAVAKPASEIHHTVMAKALTAGTAITLTPAITDIVRYADRWWLMDRDTWLRVTDVQLEADLDAFARRVS